MVRASATPDRARAAAVALAALLGGGLWTPAPAPAQAWEGLADDCVASGGGAAADACVDGALALQATRSGIGLAAAGGSGLPGTASTVGRRLGATPRLSVAFRASGTRHRRPRIFDDASSTGDEGVLVPAAHLRAALGITDGLSPAPTVGGLLSVDLLASLDYLALPRGDGFDEGVTAWGLGVRLGIVRESFTLPGFSLSAVHRRFGEVRLSRADAPVGGVRELDFDLSQTSLRATVSKDFLPVGLLAGAGWDRYTGEAGVRVAMGGGGGGGAGGRSDDVADDRFLVYGGASLTFLVVQLSAEGGWAAGHDAFPESRRPGFDPGGGSPFGALAVRITF